MGHCFLVLNHDVNGANKAYLVASLTQNSANNISGSCFAIGAGNTNHAQTFARIIKKVRSNKLHSLASILYHKQGYPCRNFLRKLFH